MELEFGGDKMLLRESEDGSAVIEFNNTGTGRSCGGCTLCCKLLPVRALNKPACTRCQHQRSGKGCAIYDARPGDCRTWSCRWLCDPNAAGLPRPDRCHYVVDLIYDHVLANGKSVPALQIWLDPAFPHAHHDPHLRRYLAMMAERFGAVALLRWDSDDGVILVAPPLNSAGKWLELSGTAMPRESFSDLCSKVAGGQIAEAP